MSQIKGMLEDIYSHIEAGSDLAVVFALLFTFITFLVTYRHSKKTEKIKRIQDIKNTISNENQKMIQNLLSVREANLDLSDDLIRDFYIPIFEAAEWASFLIYIKDIDSKYEEHLREQIKNIYQTISNKYPKLLQNSNFPYLKKVVTRWNTQTK
jgi:CRISPR/Cas system endoribonuclease Cas6 (RAMP superfamily)